VLGGQPQPSKPIVSPSISGGATVRPDDKRPVATDNMEVDPRQVAAANAPQPSPVPQPQPTQLPAPPPIAPRPVQTIPQQPQPAPQQAPLPPQRPMIPQPVAQQAPAPQQPQPTAVPPGMVVGPDGRLTPDLTQAAQPPVPPTQTTGMSPATEAALRQSGLIPEGRTVAQHVNLLQRAAALAQSSGVRDAGKVYIDALNNIAKVIEQSSAMTDMGKNYQMYLRQGGTASFEDFQSQQMSQDLRFAVDKDTMKEIGSQAAQMVRVRPLLDEALRLSEKSYSGYAGTLAPYWSKVVSAFGMNPGEMASNTEALRSIAQQLVPLVRQPGATSNYEAQLYLDAVISPGLSKEARIKVGNMIVKLVDRSVAVAKIYRQNAGSPDLYDKIAELDKSRMFTPGETAFLTAAANKTRESKAQEATPEAVAAEIARRKAQGAQ
jgi:hypothetical protein